ncbi:S1C family serine protease [Shumkonia mesophila]|uniref:S1C family serine protease n=1 Tax=Shumkonia mesophila TaxID=2838854 RepID=UPI002934D983|nr:trypsin-like peptidase domain-containing protein [Shumkonia mesophila]
MAGRTEGRVVFLAMAAALLAGCNHNMVAVETAPRLQAAEIANREELAPMRFNRLSINLRRGTVVGGYEKDLITCYPYGPDKVVWNSGRVLQRDIEFEDLFFEEMSLANFNVVGDPKDLFSGARREEIKPEYLVSAQIEDIRMNVCEVMGYWTAKPDGTFRGEASVRVLWQVFSVFDQNVVYETTTKGSIKRQEARAGGEVGLLTEAFSEAVANLAADRKLVDLLGKRTRTVADVRAVADAPLKIPYQPPFQSTITDNIDAVRRSVVTLDGGAGHGSGFFISPTLIVTNHHVVAGQTVMRVTLVTGRKVLGEVMRRHPERDVALVQVEAAGHQPLPLRLEPVRITEEIYAVGSPLDKALAGTVTKGIVSKFATNTHGLEDIQADVDIQPGNSGGALLDTRGNVVGISYAGIGETSVGLNFFIPIYDALERLNVGIDKTRGLTVAN